MLVKYAACFLNTHALKLQRKKKRRLQLEPSFTVNVCTSYIRLKFENRLEAGCHLCTSFQLNYHLNICTLLSTPYAAFRSRECCYLFSRLNANAVFIPAPICSSPQLYPPPASRRRMCHSGSRDRKRLFILVEERTLRAFTEKQRVWRCLMFTHSELSSEIQTIFSCIEV